MSAVSRKAEEEKIEGRRGTWKQPQKIIPVDKHGLTGHDESDWTGVIFLVRA